MKRGGVRKNMVAWGEGLPFTRWSGTAKYLQVRHLESATRRWVLLSPTFELREDRFRPAWRARYAGSSGIGITADMDTRGHRFIRAGVNRPLL